MICVERCGRKAAARRTVCETCRSRKEAAGRNAARQRRRQERRLRLIAAYGGHCVECGEEDTDVLLLDHVNDDGAEHRRRVGLEGVYADLERRGYPPEVQLLCANDSMRKDRRRYGY